MRPTNTFLAFLYDSCLLLGWFLGSIRSTFRGRHVKHLEAENARLIGENKALWQAVARTRGVAIDLPNDIPTTTTGHPGARTNGAPETRVKSSGDNTPRRRHESFPQMADRLTRQSRDEYRREAEAAVAAHLNAQAPPVSNGAGQMEPPEAGETN